MGNSKESQECAIKMREKKSPGSNTLTMCWVQLCNVAVCGGGGKRQN